MPSGGHDGLGKELQRTVVGSFRWGGSASREGPNELFGCARRREKVERRQARALEGEGEGNQEGDGKEGSDLRRKGEERSGSFAREKTEEPQSSRQAGREHRVGSECRPHPKGESCSEELCIWGQQA